MSQRDKERKDSLAALGRIAESVSKPIVPPKPSPSLPQPRPAAPAPRPAAKAPAPAPAAPMRPAFETEADRKRRLQQEDRKAKLEEARALKERRERELARSRNLEWRGGGFTDIPASIRRTGFDRHEPSLESKIGDVIGAAREKEGRVKHREKGRRHGGG